MAFPFSEIDSKIILSVEKLSAPQPWKLLIWRRPMAIPTLPGTTLTSLIIDISHFQANADLAAARAAGVIAVFLKATEGATYQDPAFATLYAETVAAGLKIGAYHFGTAAAIQDQVDNFVTTVTNVAGGFDKIIAALDLEDNQTNTMTPDQGDAWVAAFRQATGRTPLLYAGGYLRGLGGASGQPNLAGCPLWLAQYGETPQVLPGWTEWTLWQFTDGTAGPYAGSVPGVGPCDQDVFQGDAAGFEAFWTKYATAPTASGT
jgi:lysozyme